MEVIVKKPTAEEIQKMKQQPIWEKEVSTFPWHYDDQETCLILDGEVTVKTKNGTVSFKAGDLVIFPKGLDCTWNIKSPVRKHYKFG